MLQRITLQASKLSASLLLPLPLALALAWVHPAAAEITNFEADLHEADWQAQSSVFECQLRQAIPDFGEAGFRHVAGDHLQFRLLPFSPLLGQAPVQLEVRPAPWNYQQQGSELAQLSPVHESGAIVLEQSLARQLMAEMLDGMVPTFKGTAHYDPDQPLTVALSPLHFQRAYRDYQACAAALLPVNYEQIGRASVFFPSGGRKLDADALQLLDDIVRYANADSTVTGFEVDSFTDTAGDRRANLLLSQQRAMLVTDYLISQGIDPETIATRAHGEREEYLIVNPEKTIADRNRNRRVNIVMLRH